MLCGLSESNLEPYPEKFVDRLKLLSACFVKPPYEIFLFRFIASTLRFKSSFFSSMFGISELVVIASCSEAKDFIDIVDLVVLTKFALLWAALKVPIFFLNASALPLTGGLALENA